MYITNFKQLYPKMDVKVVIDNSNKVQQYVLSNQIDIGLIEGIVRAVQANLGVSVLPYLLVKDSIERKDISQFQLNGIQL